jgi:hypothetical protein
MRLLLQSLTLILATLAVLGVIFTPLFPYIPAILILIGIASATYGFYRKKRKRGQEVFPGSNKEIFTIIVFVLLVIFITGGIKSPIFFLAYFLLFGITFIFEPLTIFVFMICIATLFLPESLQDDVVGNMIKLGSLIVLGPIAYFFGREYKKREKLNKNIKDKTGIIIEDAKQVMELKDKNDMLKKAEEIIEEAEKLKTESD